MLMTARLWESQLLIDHFKAEIAKSVDITDMGGLHWICQNSEVVQGYGVTGRVHRRSFRADKTRLQLVCCALVQEPGCLVISEGRSPERGTGFRNGLRELWRVKQEE